MKQTNAAITFLIAQYRAVLRSANLKALSSAVVLAAGLASVPAHADTGTTLPGTGGPDQAQGPDVSTGGQTNSGGGVTPPPAPTPAAKPYTNDTFASEAKTDLVIGGDEKDSYTVMTLSGGFADTADKALNITLSGGENTLKGVAAGSGTEAKPNIDLSHSKMSIAAKDTNTSILAVGDGTNEVKVSLKQLDVTKGKVDIGTAQGTAASILAAERITLGTEQAPKAAPGAQGAPVAAPTTGVILNINNKGMLGSATANIDVYNDATVVAASGSSVAGTLNIKGGAVTTADAVTIDGKLNVSAGSLETSKTGDTVTTVKGEASFTGENVLTNSGTIVFEKHATFADKSVKESKGGVRFATTAEMNAATLKTLLSGEVSSSESGTAVISISDAEVDLSDAAEGLGLIASGNGAIKTNLKNQKDGTLTVDFKKGVFAHNVVSGDASHAKVTLAFDDLELGDGKADTVSLKKANVKVASGLTVSGDKTLELSEGSTLTLSAEDGAVHNVAASGITLGTDTKAAGTNGSLKVDGGKWSIKNLTINSGDATVVDSELKITGDLVTTEAGKLNASGSSTIDTIGGGKVSLAKAGVSLAGTSVLKLESKDILDKDNKATASLASGSITGSASTVLELDKDGKYVDLTKEQFSAIKSTVGDGFKGLYRVNITDLPAPTEGMDIGSVQENVTTEKYDNTGVTVSKGSTGVDKVYSVGNITVKDDADLTIASGGSLTLNKPNSKGQFVTKNNGKDLSDVTFQDAANELTLNGNGDIGAIKNGTNSDAQGILNVGGSKASNVTVKGAIGASGKAIASVSVDNGSKLDVQGDVFTKDLSIASGSLTASDKKVEVSGKATIMGDVDAASLSFSNTAATEHVIAGNSQTIVDTLTVGDNNTLLIGQDKVDEKNLGSTAAVYTDELRLNSKSVIFVDPEYGKKAAILAAKTVKTVGASTPNTDVGSVAGKIYVGQNAALGIGFTQEEFDAQMSNFVDTEGSFANLDKKGMHNALVLNMPIEISSGSGIAVDPTLKHAEVQAGTSTVAGDTFSVKSGSVVLTDKAFGANKKTAAIKLSGTSTNTVTFTDSEIELVGDFSTKDKDITFFSGTGLKITNAIKVKALGGLIEGTIDSGNSLAAAALNAKGFELSPNADKLAYDGVSRPVGDMFIRMAKGDIEVDSGKPGYNFVTTTLGLPDGFKQVDAAAHAATYAGAQQAAIAAVETMADAVGSRVGSLGVEATAIQTASSALNGGAWVTPMYKSVDADGFGAQGASYGADVDLAGVAFGADTVNGNMRFGAVFNIGSGDADGKGSGAGLKDEFDYYGFGIYSAMGFGQLSVVADASVNVISHDVKGGELKASADTTSVTMGVTGQYAISTSAVDVIPHVGARFIRLDTESYKLRNNDGAFANTDFDVQNVFSVPVGVSLSKAFEMGGWSLAPSADLTLTFNAGDTEVDSSTRFDGINENIGLSTEVLDEVTYGVSLGLGAQFGAFGTNIGIKYTGSENTDAFGVNANARYAF